MKNKLIAIGKASIIKLEGTKKAHYLPSSISSNPNFPLKENIQNIVELYDGFIIIRPKRKDE